MGTREGSVVGEGDGDGDVRMEEGGDAVGDSLAATVADAVDKGKGKATPDSMASLAQVEGIGIGGSVAATAAA
jgi:hypothetical protein